MQLDVIILFFILGVIAKISRSGLNIPAGLHQGISIFLMLAIGLKGGIALAGHISYDILKQSFVIMMSGFLFPLIAYPLLTYFGGFSRDNSASVAAHFGSVSIGTYAVAVALLESQNIAYEAYFPVFVVLLEFPAMIIGVILAKSTNKKLSAKTWLKEIFANQSLVLLFGGMAIGVIAGEQTAKIMPFFADLFYGVLAIFLLEMGILAAGKLADLKKNGSFLVAFGILMPLINAAAGGLLGSALGFSAGGIFLTIVLSASASYIAVPMAMRTMIPSANPALGLTASLGVAFPFNIVVGLPIYWLFAQWLMAN
ncbi:sodium-dependent bicarbonate transport family permease [Aliikangiella coralliicola]|uniref:Sodium-dependent bicarbonate transport family permease n=1 Tax=Aliikangiella coralliicola TaxID=2592383 RepID=A0A545U4E3_9GAMM|nr:sodium-dependent bicarbonate transport family permease [Aliikangiella coralliicola]TQV84332.1 sodium-dependent bicarbonate transport family permease [Aliikangiella coralliicola]